MKEENESVSDPAKRGDGATEPVRGAFSLHASVEPDGHKRRKQSFSPHQLVGGFFFRNWWSEDLVRFTFPFQIPNRFFKKGNGILYPSNSVIGTFAKCHWFLSLVFPFRDNNGELGEKVSCLIEDAPLWDRKDQRVYNQSGDGVCLDSLGKGQLTTVPLEQIQFKNCSLNSEYYMHSIILLFCREKVK